MSYFKQLRLLLRHKILLRKRQPIISSLELFWPALVFLAVFFVRFYFPPQDRPTCFYNSKALPSAGAVNFWQSLVCNIDNPCVNSSTYREIPQYSHARIHKLVDHVSPLLTDKRVTGVIRDLPKGIRMIATVIETLSQKEVRSTLENGLAINEIMRDNGIEHLREFLSKTLRGKMSETNIQVLVNSHFNIVMLSLMSGRSASPLKDIICDPKSLAQYIFLPNFSVTQQVSSSICTLETTELQSLLQLIQDELDFIKIMRKLSHLLRTVGLADFLSHVENIASMLETIEKTNIFSSLNALLNSSFINEVPLITEIVYDLEYKLHNAKSRSIVSLVTMSKITHLDSVTEKIDQVIFKIKSKLENIALLKTFQTLKLGLISLKKLTNQKLFEIKYKFSDLIRNVKAVEIFMEYHLGVEQSVVKAILNSTIDFTDNIASGEVDPNLLCNRTQLLSKLSIPKSDFGEEVAPPDIAAHAICTLSIAENYRFTTQILNQLAVRKIVQNFVILIGDGILTKANLSPSEVSVALKGLKAASKAMPYVKGYVGNFVNTLDLSEELDQLNLKSDGIELLGAPQASVILGKLMCGQALPQLDKEMQLMKVAVKKPRINEEDLAALPSKFCKECYQQIMRMQGGAVVWSFLKPILSGKVLYAPKNEFSDGIMTRMNSSFVFMNGFVDVVQAWAQTISSVETFYKNPNASQNIKDSQHLLVQFLGKDMEGLFKDVDTSNLIEKIAKAGGLLGLVRLIGNIANCVEVNRYVGFDSEIELEEAARKLTKAHELIGGIIFTNLEKNGQPVSQLPSTIEYKLRLDIDFVPTTKELKARIWEPGPRDNYLSDLGYFKGFVQLQEMIDRAITSMFINDTKLLYAPQVHLQQFPYLCYEQDKFGNYIRALAPLITTVAWIFLIAFLIREHVLERELQLEEVLRVMGLRPGVAWMTWFILGFLVMAFGCFCGLSILRIAGLIPKSNIFVLYLFFLTFSLSLMMYCYMMSSFFKTATIAALSGIVAYLASFLPFMVATTLENEMSYLHKILTCFSMSSSFCYGMMYMTRFEVQGVGTQWTNLWHSPMHGDSMNTATAMIMMLVDSVIYFLIGWYISHVCPPGNNAQRYPWYFFLMPTFWGFGKKRWTSVKNKNVKTKLSSKAASNGNTYPIKKNPNKLSTQEYEQQKGMELHGLYVIYNKGSKSKHVAVSNLNLRLKEGQITTLLGRNGAGKTTTINVLTGQMPPTAGSVFIYGHPIPEEFMEARKLLGYCPQYNTLFKELTVKEHLRFYSDLKGLLDDNEIDDDINKILHSTGLWHLQHHIVKHLSGGLQRRLCVALAFVGGSKLIILDEPTASVDPVARRSIWDLIVQHKQSRTVLLSTHHMDEAEILSDQVAVIHCGKLLCIGSPLLLRSKYGCGYQLTTSRQGIDEGDNDSGRSSNGASDEQSDVERLLAFTKCLIPNATLIEDYGSEVVLSLPQHSPGGNAHDYATFFRCLDANINALGFGSYGLKSTNLEEVFLTLCNLEESNMPMEVAKLAVARKLSHPLNQDDSTHDLPLQIDPSVMTLDWTCPELVSGVELKLKQLWALLCKRSTHTFRDWKSLFFTLFLPCIFMAFAMGMTLIKPQFAPDPVLPVVPNIYGHNTASFYSAKNVSHHLHKIIDHLLNTSKTNSHCLESRKDWVTAKCPLVYGNSHETYLPKHLQTLEGEAWSTNTALCKCNECMSDISNFAQLIPTPTKSGHGLMYNLSQVDTSEFLLKTYPEFMDRRWGGWSFHQGEINENSPFNKDVIKVWYDNTGYHSMPSFLSAVNNAIMMENLRMAGVKNSSHFKIITYSHPLHMRSSQLGDQSVMQRAGDAGIALIILVGFIFIPTSFVFYVVRERTLEEKQLQRIFGVGTILYWISALIWDMMNLLVAIALSGIIISCFQLPIYTARLNFPAVLTLLLAFGWAMTNIVYLMEKLFSEASIAFMIMYCLALFIGMNTMIIKILIDVFKLIETSASFKATFERIALIFPPYTLLSGLTDIHRNQLFADIFTLFGQDTYVNPFSAEMLGPHFTTLAIEGAVLFLINLLLEYLSFAYFRVKHVKKISPFINEDGDVAEERRRVHQNGVSQFDILRVLGVSKSFQSMFGKRIAVDNVSFSVPKGECFGLLGVNGAGKTTLFRILTGQLKPTHGEAIINGKEIRNLLSSNYQSLGYCPQADALDFVLTPQEHLTIYANMRGIPSQHIPTIVNESLSKFQLMPYSQMPVFALSRGNRRKLCLAIAMLGNPQIALLDEPTSGLDPQSRRYICQNIQNAIRDRRSVVLTSHSMEECDILCSRLAIMVNGRFKCIGSPHYLKHKFGTGYTITLRLSENESNWNDVINYMKQCFPSIVLRAHHHNMIEFSLPTNEVPLSNIFDQLQNAQETLHLQDFSVSQTTLDQVFVSFANQQVNDYQSPIPSRSKSSYSNPAFTKSTEQLNHAKSNGNAIAKHRNVNNSHQSSGINAQQQQQQQQHPQHHQHNHIKARNQIQNQNDHFENGNFTPFKSARSMGYWHEHFNTSTTQF